MAPEVERTPADPRPAPPSRRAAVLVVLAAVVALLATSAVLNRGVSGLPTALPLPDPPPIGSCLVLTAESSTVVPCTAQHHAEVVRTWPAGTLPPGIATYAAVASFPFDSAGRVSTADCADAQEAWVQDPAGPGTDRWTASTPVVDNQLLAAPAAERTADRGWVACLVVAPDRRPFAGSLRVGTATPPPSRLTSCLQIATDGWGPVTLPCDQPHRVEILGSFRIRSVFDADGRFVGTADAATLAASCAALAGAVMRTDDPTAGGRLEVRATSYFPGSIWEVDATDPAGNPVNTYIPLPQCAVDLVGEGSLTGTVVGLGDAPLPLG